MEKIVLNAVARPAGNPSKLRKQNMVLAVLYGHNIPTEHLAMSYTEFEKVFRKAGESTIIQLSIDGNARNVLIQDVQRHFLTNKFMHADFYAVSMTEKLKATIPLEVVGTSPAVKEGNILVNVLSEVEVECLPGDLPHSFEVDISVLKVINDAIHVKDLKVSDKVQIMTDGEEVVAKISAPRDVEAELAEPIVEDVSTVEGAAEDKPVAEGEAAEKSGGKEEKADKKE